MEEYERRGKACRFAVGDLATCWETGPAYAFAALRAVAERFNAARLALEMHRCAPQGGLMATPGHRAQLHVEAGEAMARFDR